MSEPFVNKVANSGLITINLETYLPKDDIAVFDLKAFLFMEMILKEKEFRTALKEADWEKYKGKNVAIVCSADAVIPVWAYMLVTTYLQPVAQDVYLGAEKEFYKKRLLQNIDAIDIADFDGQRIVIKGCGETPIEEYAYMEITKKLLPVAKSIMYGEPCSTVPVYKQKIQR